MKRYIVALLLVCALTVMAQQQPTRSAHFEYRFVTQCDEKKANNLAAEGWELTDMSMASFGSVGVATCVFKRPK